jgi:hypothetical protein
LISSSFAGVDTVVGGAGMISGLEVKFDGAATGVSGKGVERFDTHKPRLELDLKRYKGPHSTMKNTAKVAIRLRGPKRKLLHLSVEYDTRAARRAAMFGESEGRNHADSESCSDARDAEDILATSRYDHLRARHTPGFIRRARGLRIGKSTTIPSHSLAAIAVLARAGREFRRVNAVRSDAQGRIRLLIMFSNAFIQGDQRSCMAYSITLDVIRTPKEIRLPVKAA